MTHATTPDGLIVESRGAGPEVVLVHGILGDYRQWSELADVLDHDHRVRALSRRYHWPSPPPAPGVAYTAAAQAADLERLLQSLGTPSHLVGHSYGAGLVLLTALLHSELVRSVTLIEPPCGSLPSAPALAPERASRTAMIEAVRESVDAGAPERGAELLIDWVQGGRGGFRRLPRAVRDHILENAATLGPTVSSPGPDATCEEVRELRVPVLVLRGERTRPWYRLIAEAASACIPGAQIAIIARAGHMAILENAAATATLVRGFIAQHERH